MATLWRLEPRSLNTAQHCNWLLIGTDNKYADTYHSDKQTWSEPRKHSTDANCASISLCSQDDHITGTINNDMKSDTSATSVLLTLSQVQHIFDNVMYLVKAARLEGWGIQSRLPGLNRVYPYIRSRQLGLEGLGIQSQQPVAPSSKYKCMKCNSNNLILILTLTLTIYYT